MTEIEMLKNVRCMEEMFPAFIDHYKRAALGDGNLETWAKAIRSVIDLVTHDAAEEGSTGRKA